MPRYVSYEAVSYLGEDICAFLFSSIFFLSKISESVLSAFAVSWLISLSVFSLMVLWMVSVVLVWNILLVKLLSYKVWIDWLRVKSRWLYYISGGCFIFFSLMLFMMNKFD